MEDQARTQMILAAVGAAGPMEGDGAAWQARVEHAALSIMAMTTPNSTVAKAIERMAGSKKPFKAAIMAVQLEQSSTRAVVTFDSGSTREPKPDAITKQLLPPGCEQVRTDRTDTPSGLAMAQRLWGLIGHDVVIWIFIEEGDQKNYRLVAHVEDLGLSASPLAQQGLAFMQRQQVQATA